jgi:3D (Asp-Asp-Asp) domain-containing protein
MTTPLRTGLLVALCCTLGACGGYEHSLPVTATAYHTDPDQRSVTAWGDTLRPGMKALAVSRDLIPMGLDYGTEVKVEGLPGAYVVLDKMAPRWDRRIDIYMDTDEEAAQEWGVQEVTIHW